MDLSRFEKLLIFFHCLSTIFFLIRRMQIAFKLKPHTYKYDVILGIVGISSAYIESVSLHRLQNADMIATVKQLRDEIEMHYENFFLFF